MAQENEHSPLLSLPGAHPHHGLQRYEAHAASAPVASSSELQHPSSPSASSSSSNPFHALFHSISFPKLPRRSKRDSTLAEKLTSSPMTKFFMFGTFPLALLVNIALAILVTVHVFALSEEKNPFFGAIEGTLQQHFVASGAAEKVHGRYTRYIYTLSDFRTQIDAAVQNYYNLSSLSIDSFAYYPDMPSLLSSTPAAHIGPVFSLSSDAKLQIVQASIPPMQLSVETYNSFHANLQSSQSLPNRETTTTTYYLTPSNSLGPFDGLSDTELQSALQSVKSMETTASLCVLDVNPKIPKCVKWIVSSFYSFETRGGRMQVLFNFLPSPCGTSNDVTSLSNAVNVSAVWVNFFIGILAILCFILSFRSVRRRFQLFSAVRKSLRLSKNHQESLSFRDLSLFINPWRLVNIVASCLTLASALLSLQVELVTFVNINATGILVALSCIFTWVAMIAYLETYPSFYRLVRALSRGIPNVFRFIVGVLPFFIGYALAGTVLFGSYSPYFSSVGESCVTLFSSANGDAIHDIFNSIQAKDWSIAVLSRIFMYSYVALFVLAVLSTFITIMSDAYSFIRDSEETGESTTLGRKRRLEQILAAASAAEAAAHHSVRIHHVHAGALSADGNISPAHSIASKVSFEVLGGDECNVPAEALVELNHEHQAVLQPPSSPSFSAPSSEPSPHHHHHHQQHHQQRKLEDELRALTASCEALLQRLSALQKEKLHEHE